MTDNRKSAYDTMLERRAVESFRASPEDALAGVGLASAETDPGADRTRAIAELAREQPERFLELVGYLPHAIQDVFYQYFLLGRTQTQIGKMLETGQSGGNGVWKLLNLGIEGICAIIAFGGPPRGEDWVAAEGSREGKLLEAYKAMEKFGEWSGREMSVEAPGNLGEFVVGTGDGNLGEFFAPRPGVRKC